jgi:hypothetical protein
MTRLPDEKAANEALSFLESTSTLAPLLVNGVEAFVLTPQILPGI